MTESQIKERIEQLLFEIENNEEENVAMEKEIEKLRKLTPKQ